MNIRKLMYWLLLLGFVLCLMRTALAGDSKPDQKSYYQHPPSQTLQPGSIWNPIITEKKDGTTYKSYYKLPDSKTTPQGSIWNPLQTVKEKGK